MIKIIFAIIILVILYLYINKDYNEAYSQAALTQLVAKGPQDTYLTGDAWKYIPPYGYYGYYGNYYPNSYYPYRYGDYPYSFYPYNYYPWNISTRIKRRYRYW